MACWTFPSILAFIFSFLCCCNGQGSFILVAPNLMRTDSPENIFLQANDFSGSTSILVTITIKEFSTNGLLSGHSATLNQENNFHTLTPIQVPSHSLNRDEKKHKFVVLEVRFGNYHTEKRVIMVSFQVGYIFIQTDKPIYKPGDEVKIRAFVSSPSFKASDANAISLDIKNPEDVVVDQKSKVKPTNGVFKRPYPLPDLASEGKWTVVAKFDNRPQNNFNATFEVKKYVLPAFNVTLLPNKPYLDVNDTKLEVEIKARYLYGEPVTGIAYVVYGLKKGQKMMRSPKVKQVEMQEDGGILKLTMDEIKEACEVKSGSAEPDCTASSLVDSFVYIKVSVLTTSGGDLVEVEKSNIKIVHSPYVLTLKDMPKYFKPNLPFHFTIHVTYHDGSPANDIPLEVNLLESQLTSSSGTAGVSINMPNSATPLKIIVKTKKFGLIESKQAITEVTIDPYRSANSNYLYIHSGNNKVEMRELPLEMSINSNRRTEIKEITYLIVSKGKILDAKRTAVSDQQVTTVTAKITADMLPTFRFVAFYTLPHPRTEVVADSNKLELAQTCVKPLHIGPKDNMLTDYIPGKSSLKLKIRGEPLAHISLVAVDQAVYLLSKNRFNQKHILDEVESRDMACTQGGGKDAMGVFTDAGLVFASSTGTSTESRQEFQCPDNARRRRSAALMEHQAKLMGEFQEKLLHRCCRDGLRGVAMPYSCEQRSLYIAEGPECIKAFLKCCNIYRNKVSQLTRPDDLELGRGSQTGSGASSDVSNPDENESLSALGDDDEYDIDDIYLRDKLNDAWLWMDVSLPEKTDMDGLATHILEQAIPDSITQWAVHAVSSSAQTGFCVAEPWTFVAKKPFFVDIKLPFSVARNEQVEIKAVLYNNLDEDLEVNVVLRKTSGMCSVAFKRDHRQKVRVRPRTSVVVSYTVVPFEQGKKPIEVAAFVIDRSSDRIMKTLNVVVEGVQKTDTQSYYLKPSGFDGTQTVRTGRPVVNGLVPNSEPITKIIFSGNILSDSIENAIHDDPLARLIQMPGGCVEQNLAGMTFPIIAAHYLEKTNSWMNVGVQRKIDALKYISQGYSNQLVYRRYDGSYPPYQGKGPSTWVTAYVVKVFSMAYPFLSDMDLNHICQPLGFLLTNKQQPQGYFIEDNPVRNIYMAGGLRGAEQQVTLTAFVIIALAEVRQRNIDCSYLNVDTQSAINKAVPYLKSGLQSSSRPYTKAITSYALALLKDEISYDPTSTLLAASSDGRYWDNGDNGIILEATGYALLALVKMGRLTEAKKTFNYLSNVRNIDGGSWNTQSTMVLLQAMSEYLIVQPPPDKHSLDVALRIASPNLQRKEYLNFNAETSYQARSFNVPKDADLEVVAKGNGEGTVKVVTFYNQLLEEDAKSCTAFDLQVSIVKSKEKPPPGMIHVFDLTITIKALTDEPALSVVLDVSLPTGFTPETRDLENLLNSVDRYIDHFYFDDKLSERSSLIIHMYKVSNTMSRILSFKLYQQFNVGLLQPSSVTVYEYYKDKAPGQVCTRLYTPPQDQAQLTTLCRNRVCTCAQDDCCGVKDESRHFSADDRETFACKTLHHVFQVKVLSVSNNYYDKYEMEITKIIKLGLESGVLESEKRFFYSHGGCREKCRLQLDAEYLIMGPESDRWTMDSKTNKYMYVLGKDTWVERWPTATECTDPTFKAKCDALTEAAESLNQAGCRAKK